MGSYGFADRPELPLAVRVRLARLGERYAPKKLSAAQRELLASPMAERDAARRISPEMEGFQADALDAERAWEEGVYDELSDEQRQWVSHPNSHPALPADTRYPLTLGQLHLLTGASERQCATGPTRICFRHTGRAPIVATTAPPLPKRSYWRR